VISSWFQANLKEKNRAIIMNLSNIKSPTVIKLQHCLLTKIGSDLSPPSSILTSRFDKKFTGQQTFKKPQDWA
jgi:hypothetical protein